MSKWCGLILVGCLVVSGCEGGGRSSRSESDYDRVSREIEQLKATAQGSGTGENVKITVKMLSVSEREYGMLDLMLRYMDTDAAIAKLPHVFVRSGLKVGVANQTFEARLDFVRSKLKSWEESEVFVVVAYDASGYINAGTEIAIPQFYHLGRRFSSVEYGFRQAGRSLRVTPRRGRRGAIMMEITPVFSKFTSSGGDLELTELTTTVTAQPGQTIVLGGSASSHESVATALLSRQDEGETKRTVITVTPEVR